MQKFDAEQTAAASDAVKRATAHHEAGRMTLTLASKHFELSDPAAYLRAVPGKSAQSGNRLSDPKNSHLDRREKDLERVMIALGGLVAEELFADISYRGEGAAIVLHADSTRHDIEYVQEELGRLQAKGDIQEIMGKARARLREHIRIWQAIAAYLLAADGRDSVSKAEIESIESVRAIRTARSPSGVGVLARLLAFFRRAG